MEDVRVKRAFKQVPDFETDEKNRPIRFEDPVANKLAQAQRVRECFIAIERVNLLRRRLTRCYHEEGVNHYENCADIAKEYYNLVHAPNFGALYPQPKP